MIDIREALTRAADQLAAHPDLRPTAVPDATLLFMHYLDINRAALIAHPERPLTREQLADIQRLVERRLRFEPIQYITGTQEFYGLPLRVTPAVLIPRPETELLVEAVLTHLRVPHPRDGSIVAGSGIGQSPTGLRILDIGTGSGAIAIALAHHLPQAQITALDLSPEALAIARENAQSNSVQIRFLESDLLAAVADEPPFDAIVSNPPYIPTSDAPTLHPQVRDHEPSTALFAGPYGLEIYTRLIPQAHALLKAGGLLALEIGHGQQSAIAALLRDWHHVCFLPDLNQIPRVALAHRP